MASFPTDAGIRQLRSLMDSNALTAAEIVQHYCARISALNPQLNCVIEINPDVFDIATELDREHASSGPRGPLHGIPVLLKDNIDTGDRQGTTAGSLSLSGVKTARDAFVAARLRRAGAVILGKANLSEWANFRSTKSTSGWSAVGKQCRNPYDLDRTPCGSSSGSAVAVAADLAPVSLGTETDGSILCPGSMCSVVGIKPTVGLTSRSGVVPISHSQDSIGPFARTVADAAALLGAIVGVDPTDPATAASEGRHQDYTRFLEADGLRGARIGVPREGYFGANTEADAAVESAIEVMRELGADIIDPVTIPSVKPIGESEAEITVLLYEFKADLAGYLAGRPGSPVGALADVIRFNEEHAAEEMPYFAQELFLMAEEKGPLTDPAYREALEESRRLSRREGIDAVMDEHRLDAIIAPSGRVAWPIDYERGDAHDDGPSLSTPAAMAGYPALTVPVGYADGLPLGMIFTGRAFSEPTLIRLAHAFEQATKIRKRPPIA
jgi:amidase